MKLFTIIIGLLTVLVACAPSTQTTVQSGSPITPRADGKQARLAVLNFRGEHGSELSDSLNTALFRTGRFILLERDGLSGLQSEAAIGQNPTAFEGADVVVIGSITAFEPNAGGTNGGGIGIGLPFIGGIQLGANEAYIAADLRLIEVKTRRILNIVKVEGKSSSFNVGGFGGGFLGPVFIGGGLSTYAKQPMGKAIAVMLQAAVQDLSKGIPEVYYVDPTAAPVVAKPAPVATSGSASNAETKPTTSTVAQSGLSIPKILPGNGLPFFDDFEGRNLQATLPETYPQQYGRSNCPVNSESEDAGIGIVGTVKDRNQNATKAIELTESKFCNSGLIQVRAVTTGSADWKNYSISFNFIIAGEIIPHEDGLGVRFNLSPDSSSYHSVWFHSFGSGDVVARKVLGSQQLVLASRQMGPLLTDIRWRNVVIENRNGTVKVSMDSNLILEFQDTDPRYAQGGVGFMRGPSLSNVSIFVDDLKIEALK
jgi:curli biogenesis system outer membrane secretion channel CsgG